MISEEIPSSLFVDNRKKVCNLLPANTLAVVHSNDQLPSNADVTYKFQQNSNLLYLTGIHQEETSLILFPDAVEKEMREILFVRPINEDLVIWEGKKLSVAEAKKFSGIKNVKTSDQFSAVFKQLAIEAEKIALETNEHARASYPVKTRNEKWIEQCQSDFPLHQYVRLAPLLVDARMIKHETEIELMQKAWDITESGFLRVLQFVKPGVGEWEIEAEYAHEFLKKGAAGFAYEPIIGSGENACYLHYVKNNNRCQDGELLLMDVASEWQGWNSDMTRTIPVNGKFTDRQRAVYQSVLDVLRACNEFLRPGISKKDYEQKAKRLIGEELVKLGLIDQKTFDDPKLSPAAIKKYFMHGTSHHIGIDVHDVTAPNSMIEEGMVFTIEPGIYIAEEKLAVRLENNVLVGKDGNLDLSEKVPIEIAEIEALMQ